MKSDFLPPGVDSLCQLSDRYEAAVQGLRGLGVAHPDRLSDVLAPRFIYMPDWLSMRESHHFNPWLVYKPAPQTWSSWERGRDFVERQAQDLLQRGKGPHLDQDWLQKLHQTALENLTAYPGEFRNNAEIGKALVPALALSPEDVAAVRSPDYMTSFTGSPLIVWHPTECVANQTGVFAYNSHPDIDPNRFFTDKDGLQKQCGYFVYTTAAEDVPGRLGDWMHEINQESRTWGKKDPKGDPILIAARAQRWYVAIHPFEHGNGRTSRLTMDLMLESLDLPAPVLDDMNKDTVSTEAQWAKRVGEGILRHVETLETCAQDLTRPGCNEVGFSAPGT